MSRPVATISLCGNLLVSLAIGCGGGADYDGPPRAAVQGKVTFNGEPLALGTISFVPDDETQRAASGVITAGRYNVSEGKGPNFGKHKVVVSGSSASAAASGGPDMPPEAEAAPAGEEGDGEDDAEGRSRSSAHAGRLARFVPAGNIIPPRYNAQTELTREITESSHTFDFDLKDE